MSPQPVLDARDKVRAFIKENYYLPDDLAFTDDTSLLRQGIVDSTGVLELVSFLERDFEIEVQDLEILPENLDTIARIAAYIHRKQGNGATRGDSASPAEPLPATRGAQAAAR
jgi:acyl carrier protein